MKWLNLISLVLKAVTIVAAFLRERKLIQAGRAEAEKEASDEHRNRVDKAEQARRDALNGSGPADDPYQRD